MALTQEELGRRIAVARERRGVSQSELGAALDLSQSAISRLESGQRSVDSIELARIAQRLRVPVVDLLDDRPVPEELLGFAARVESARVPGAVEAARSRVLDLVRFSRALDGLEVEAELRPPPTHFSLAAALAKDEGKQLAAEVRRFLDLETEPLPDLLEIVEERLGLDVALEPLPSGIEGLCVTLEGIAITPISSAPVEGRQRFTLAHELCHFLMGDAEPLLVDEDLFGRGTQEIRANAFAAHFLMPTPGVEKRLRGRKIDGRTVCELQYTFGVSLEALLWHVRNLGLITARQRERLKLAGPKALAWRHGYLAEWEASWRAARQVRAPARLVRRAVEAYSRGLMGAERLASLLEHPDPDELRRELTDEGIMSDDWPEDTVPA